MKPFPLPPLPIDLLDTPGFLLYFTALRDAGYTWHLDEDPAEISRVPDCKLTDRTFTDDQCEILRRFVPELDATCEPLCPAHEVGRINAGAWSIADIVGWNANDTAPDKPKEEFWTADYARLYDPEKEREHGPDSDLSRLSYGRFTLCATSDELDELEMQVDQSVTALETEAQFLTCLGWLLDNADLRHWTRHGEEKEDADQLAADALVAERNALKKQVETLAAATRNLLACSELNLDELDNATVDAIEQANAALTQAGEKVGK